MIFIFLNGTWNLKDVLALSAMWKKLINICHISFHTFIVTIYTAVFSSSSGEFSIYSMFGDNGKNIFLNDYDIQVFSTLTGYGRSSAFSFRKSI